MDDAAPLDGFGRRPAWIDPFHDDSDPATSDPATSDDPDEGPPAAAPVSTPS